MKLLQTPTPLLELHNLPKALGCKARIFVKCDNTAALGAAGNKLRKLEYLATDALEQGCDTLITTGGLQSNHARLTAAVAARLGLGCELVLGKLVPRTTDNYTQNGNVLLMRHFGARLHILESGQDTKAYALQRVQQLRKEGRKPYFIPFGGSSVLGSLGYVHCAHEITRQLAEQKLQADWVFCTAGSGGTQAGLVAGFSTTPSSFTQVQGISVLFPKQRIVPIVTNLVNGVRLLLNHPPLQNPEQSIWINDQFIGAEGYGSTTPEGLEAIRLLGKTEGMVLDPVYTGRAFAGLMAAARYSQWTENTVVVFVHTGGEPGLYAYADVWAEQADADAHGSQERST